MAQLNFSISIEESDDMTPAVNVLKLDGVVNTENVAKALGAIKKVVDGLNGQSTNECNCGCKQPMTMPAVMPAPEFMPNMESPKP